MLDWDGDVYTTHGTQTGDKLLSIAQKEGDLVETHDSSKLQLPKRDDISTMTRYEIDGKARQKLKKHLNKFSQGDVKVTLGCFNAETFGFHRKGNARSQGTSFWMPTLVQIIINEPTVISLEGYGLKIHVPGCTQSEFNNSHIRNPVLEVKVCTLEGERLPTGTSVRDDQFEPVSALYSVRVESGKLLDQINWS